MQWQTEYPPNTERIRAFIRESVHTSRAANDGLTFAVQLEPGDGTHYELFGIYRSRSATQELWWVGFMVGTHGGGSAVLPMDGLLSEFDLVDTLDIGNAHSARILADWLNYFALVLRREQGTTPEQEHERVWADVEMCEQGLHQVEPGPGPTRCAACGDSMDPDRRRQAMQDAEDESIETLEAGETIVDRLFPKLTEEQVATGEHVP